MTVQLLVLFVFGMILFDIFIVCPALNDFNPVMMNPIDKAVSMINSSAVVALKIIF